MSSLTDGPQVSKDKNLSVACMKSQYVHTKIEFTRFLLFEVPVNTSQIDD